MQELIKVNYNNDRITVSARELWEGLGKPYDQFTKWFDAYKIYGFTENEDYRALSIKILTAQGNEVSATDYEITLDMAKELAMLQKSTQGSTYRKHFIEIEKQWNSPEMVMKRAMDYLNKRCLELDTQLKDSQLQLEEAKPKVAYYDLILNCKGLVSTTTIAKDYGMTTIAFNKLLHNKKIQYKTQSGQWVLYRNIDPSYMGSKTNPITHTNGDITSKVHSYWTQKGRKFIYDELKKDNIIPSIEKLSNN